MGKISNLSNSILNPYYKTYYKTTGGSTAQEEADKVEKEKTVMAGEVKEKTKVLGDKFLEEIKIKDIKDIDLRNYRVLGMTSAKQDTRSTPIFCKTSPEAWPCEFNILFLPVIKDYTVQDNINDYLTNCFNGNNGNTGTTIIVMVSEDCPGCYFIENQEIIETAEELFNLPEMAYLNYYSNLGTMGDYVLKDDGESMWTSFNINNAANTVSVSSSPYTTSTYTVDTAASATSAQATSVWDKILSKNWI